MKDRIHIALQIWLGTTLAFLSGTILIRLYEWISVLHQPLAVNSLELRGLVSDLGAFLLSAVVVGILGIIAGTLSAGATYVVQSVAYVILLLAGWITTQYFLVSGITLGADLLGYSWSDIQTTVTSSGSISISAVISVVIMLVVFTMLNRYFYDRNIFYRTNLGSALAGMALFFLLIFAPWQADAENFDLETERSLASNKLITLLEEIRKAKRATPGVLAIAPGSYPLLHPVRYSGKLSTYLNTPKNYPNIVVIVVEGLGRDFMGPDAVYGGFTPFLDSLAGVSLFWKNAVSNAGRTFGAPPSILGSLPYGDNGFMNYGNNMPHHQTLISLLKPYGYQSNFFYGGNPNFDNLDLFLEYQKTDRFINQTSFPTTIKQKASISSWGLADRDVFQYATTVLGHTNKPRLDLYLTLSTHEPFICPDTLIAARATAELNALVNSAEKTLMLENRNIFQCLRYTDQAIKDLIESYSKRPDFQETIFVITGDHRLIPMPSDNRLKRFHVPLMIYSPLVKQPVTFSSMGSHSSITPTLLGWLSQSFNINFPEEMPFLSDELDTNTDFGSSLQLAISRNKGVLSDYLDGAYYLSDDRLYEISENLEITPVQNESKRQSLRTKLAEFQARNRYACDSNRVDRGTSTVVLAGFRLTSSEHRYLQQITVDSLNPDQQFEKARQLAFDKKYEQSRIVAKYILNKSPNFHDTRVLMARTFGWQQRFDSARLLLHQTLERAPAYPDAFVALADIEFWDGQLKKSLQVAQQGLAANPNLDELKSRVRRAQEKLNKP